MTGRQIRLAKGQVYGNAGCGYAEGYLWCYLRGARLAEVMEDFGDPESTERIVFEYGEMEDVYEGFTAVKVTKEDADGCAVCLWKGE